MAPYVDYTFSIFEGQSSLKVERFNSLAPSFKVLASFFQPFGCFSCKGLDVLN
jgi:hypothetical protein